jgi:hypothetical protein
MLTTTQFNPDVLSCLANLSNDEVFTPPKLANEMLDLLPKELWSNKDAKFLDPVCKTGVFLREIAKRLLTGLENEIPHLQTRIDHVFKNQLYGIGITELTALMSRRTLYCSKKANGKYSIYKFKRQMAISCIDVSSIRGSTNVVRSVEQARQNTTDRSIWKRMHTNLFTQQILGGFSK